MRLIRRWALRLGFGLALAVLLAAGALVVASRTSTVRDLVRDRAATLLADATGADVQIGSVGGSFVHTLVVDDLRLSIGGRAVARIPRIEIAFALLPLLRGELRIERIVVERPRVRAVRAASGWLAPRPPPGGGGLPLSVVVERLVVADGRVAVALLDEQPPRRVAATGVALDASARVSRARTRVDVARLRLVPRGIALGPVSVSAALTAASGGVRVDHASIATPRSVITADGTIVRGRRVDVRAALAPLAARDVRALAPAARLLADVRARMRARGPWRAIAGVARVALEPGGTVVARATVDPEALRWDAQLAVAALDPGAAVAGLPRGALAGRATLAGEDVGVDAPIRYRAALDRSTLAGQAVDRLAIAGEGRAGVHRFSMQGAAALGRAALRARLALGTPLTYRIAGRWTVDRLDLAVPSEWGWATGRAHARGSGTDEATRRAALDVAITGASVRGVPLDRADVRARVRGPAVAVDVGMRGAAVGLQLAAHGDGDVAASRGSLTLDGGADLQRIGTYLGQPLRGALRLALRADGRLDDVRAQASATVDDAAWRDVAATRVIVRADLRGLGGSTPAGSAEADASGLRWDPNAPVAARAAVVWQRSGQTERASITLSAVGAGGRTQDAALTVVRSPGATEGTLERLSVTPPAGEAWRLVRPTRFTVDDALAIGGLELGSGAARLSLAGRLALRAGTSSASLTAERVDLAPLCALADAPPCAGEVGARMTVTGTADAPVLALDADARALRMSGIVDGALGLRVRYAERSAHVTATFDARPAGTLRADGDVPVDLAWAGPRRDLSNAPIALTARADRLDLAVLATLVPHTVRSAGGFLHLDVRVTGSRAAPAIDGDAAIDDASLELARVGVPYREIRARLRAHGTRVDILEFRARGGDGTVSVSGAGDLAPGQRNVDLTVHLADFLAARTQAYEATVRGDLALRGPFDAPALTGWIDVPHAIVRLAALPATGPSVNHDPTIVVVGGPPAETPESRAAGPGLPARLAVDVTVTVERNVWIRRTDANIELGGRLHVTKSADGPPRVVGEIVLVRGWYEFQGRHFVLDQGTVTFTGAAPPKPVFDVTAVYRTAGYRIEVHVTGSVDKPTLTMTSDPPLEQADILAVLLFGKPTSQLGRGQSTALQERALQLAAGYAVPELRTSVMDALGVDTLEVEMPESGTTNPGRVSAGRYVAEDVFVSLGQEFGGRRTGQVVGLEYDLGANISVRGSTSTRGDSAVDLFWRHRY